jgi:hypothetical protein
MDELSITKPNFYEPKDKNWFININRYITSHYYNRPFYQFRQKPQLRSFSPIDNILNNWSYYLGEQNIGLNNALIEGTATQLLYRAGLEINKLVNHKVGKASELYQTLKLSVELLGRDTRNKKQLKRDLMLLRLKAQREMQSLEEIGIIFNPLPEDFAADSEEEMMKQVETSLKEVGEKIADLLSEKAWKYNDMAYQYEEVTRQCVVGGISGVHNTIKNGMLIKEYVPAHQIIWDNTQTNVFNAKANFAGIVTYNLTSEQILEKYPRLTEDDKKEIKELSMSVTQEYLSLYNPLINGRTLWYATNVAGGITGFTVVRIYIKGRKDSQYKVVKGQVKDMKEAEAGDPDYDGQIWYFADLIGNRWLGDWGEVTNIVYDTKATQDPLCPLQIVVPNATLDQYKSDVGKVKEIQDEIDFYANKIREITTRDIGKNYWVNGQSLGISSLKDMITDFKAQNITVGTPPNDVGDQNPNGNLLIQSVDLTLDPNITKYVELKNYLKEEQRDILSLPTISLGAQNTVIGKGVQENTMAAANDGLASFYNTMLNFIQRDMQLGVNMWKLAMGDKKMSEQDIVDIVGEDGYDFIMTNKDYPFEPLGVYIQINDRIDDKERAALNDAAFAALQNQEIKYLDYIKLRRCQTLSEAENYFTVALKRSERREDAAAQQRAAEQERALQIQANAALQAKQGQNQTELAVADRKASATETAAEINARSKEANNERDNNVKLIQHLNQPKKS